MSAPHCKILNDEIQKCLGIKQDVVKKALERAKFENIHKDPRLSTEFDNNLEKWAMYKLAYYQCFKCKVPYFGGMKDCIAAQSAEADFKVEDLVCGKCAAESLGGGMATCKKHGNEFIEFKCKFCCSVS